MKQLETGAPALSGITSEAGFGNGASPEEEDRGGVTTANGIDTTEDCGNTGGAEILDGGVKGWAEAKVRICSDTFLF